MPANQNAGATQFAYRAIVPAQTVATGQSLLEITSGGKTYKFTYSADVKYDAAKVRVMNVTLGESGQNTITIPASDTTIDNWGNSEAGTGTGTVEEVIASTTLLDLSSEIKEGMPITSKGNWSSAKLADKQDYWFSRTSETTTVTFDAAEIAIKAANTTARGAWGTTSFGYHCGTKTFERATYKLTFTVKSTIVGNGVVAVGVRTSNDKKGFRISNLYAGKRNMASINFTQAEVTTGWKNFTMEVDLTQASEPTSLSDQSAFDTTTAEEVQGITILFFNNLQNAASAYDTYIKDIVFQKK